MPSEPPVELPEEVVRFARAQVAAGRYTSVADVLRAGVAALEQHERVTADWVRYARSKWDQGVAASERGESTEMTGAEFAQWLDGC